MDAPAESQPPDPWGLGETEPTNFVLPWPSEEAPTLDGVLAAIDAVVKTPLVREDAPLQSDGLEFVAIVRPADGAAPLVVWAEAGRTPPMAGLDLGPGKWVLGFETVLDPADPLLAWAGLAGVAMAAFPLPALLDVNASVWHPRDALERTLSDPVEPSADMLWTVQVIAVAEGSPVWVHTHGLVRCGLPELEMLAVPAPLAETAAAMLGDVAARLLEETLPDPGESLEVGPELSVRMIPWESVQARCPEGMPGANAGDRGESEPVPRAVLVGPEADSTCPLAVLQRLDAGGIVYRAARTTKRNEALARATWSVLHAAASLAPMDACAAIAQAVSGAAGAVDREHHWYSVQGVTEADDGEAIVVEPIAELSESPAQRRAVLRAEEVTDWCVMVEGRRFGPDDALDLHATLAGLFDDASGSRASGEGGES